MRGHSRSARNALQARLHRHAVRSVGRRTFQDSRGEKPAGVLRRVSAFRRPQRERAVGHHADAGTARGRFLRRARDSRSADRHARSRATSYRPRASARRQRPCWHSIQCRTSSSGGYNFERTTVSPTSQDNFQSRVNHAISNRDSLLGTASYQRTAHGRRRTSSGSSIRCRRRASMPRSPGRIASISS